MLYSGGSRGSPTLWYDARIFLFSFCCSFIKQKSRKKLDTRCQPYPFKIRLGMICSCNLAFPQIQNERRVSSDEDFIQTNKTNTTTKQRKNSLSQHFTVCPLFQKMQFCGCVQCVCSLCVCVCGLALSLCIMFAGQWQAEMCASLYVLHTYSLMAWQHWKKHWPR